MDYVNCVRGILPAAIIAIEMQGVIQRGPTVAAGWGVASKGAKSKMSRYLRRQSSHGGGGFIEREPIPRTGRAHTHTNATHMTPSNLSLQHISQLSHHTFTSRRGGRFGRAGGTKAPVGTEFKSRRLHQQNPEDADPATTGATEGFSDFRGAPPLKGLFEFLAHGISNLGWAVLLLFQGHQLPRPAKLGLANRSFPRSRRGKLDGRASLHIFHSR